MTTTKTKPPLDLDSVFLSKGEHATRQEGTCVMELAAWAAGKKHTDHPPCVCPVLGAFLRNWNDSLDDVTRQRLKPYALRVIGTAEDGQQERRAWMALDWLTRECTPAFLELAKLDADAAALRALPEIVDASTLATAQPALTAAANAAAAAWAAAWAAAGAAARAAAWAAAGRTLAPVVARVQESAFALLDRMCDVGKPGVAA